VHASRVAPTARSASELASVRPERGARELRPRHGELLAEHLGALRPESRSARRVPELHAPVAPQHEHPSSIDSMISESRAWERRSRASSSPACTARRPKSTMSCESSSTTITSSND
jgi:hypothetical protein